MDDLIRATLASMLEQRGYVAFPELFGEGAECDCFTEMVDDPETRVRVVYCANPNAATMRDLIESHAERHVIVVTNAPLKKAARPKLSPGTRLETFTTRELRFDVTKHADQPPIVVVSEAVALSALADLGLVARLPPSSDKVALKALELARNRRVLDSLPAMLPSDPVVRFFGGRVGDVFRITSPSKTAGVVVRYRVVRLR